MMTADAIQLRWPWPRPVKVPMPEPLPPSPDTQIAELRSAFEAFRASQEQQNAGLQEQLRIEREERRQVEIKNTDLGKELSIQKGYNDLLKGNLDTVNQIAQTLSSEVHTIQTLYAQADERLKWQNQTIENMKAEIKELQTQIAAKESDNARLTQRVTFLELHGELLTEENAEIRAAARNAGVDLREIELRIQDRRNTAAQRKRESEA